MVVVVVVVCLFLLIKSVVESVVSLLIESIFCFSFNSFAYDG